MRAYFVALYPILIWGLFVRCEDDGIIHAKLNVVYNGTVSNGTENIYYFEMDNMVPPDGTVRISVSSVNASEATPLLFVARFIRGVISWSVPFTSAEGKKYKHVSQTLCPYLNRGPKNESIQNFYVDVSSSSISNLQYILTAYIDKDFVLRLGDEKVVNTNPAEPVVFTYSFSSDQERVLVKATSDSKICATLLVQNSNCPSLGQSHGEYSGVYASMTTKAGITVERSRIKDRKFYVILIVRDTDIDCTVKKGSINPFAPVNPSANEIDSLPGTRVKRNDREKAIRITIVDQPRIEEYLGPVAAPAIFFGMFYVIAVIILGVSWCMAEDGGKTFMTYLFPKRVKAKVKGEDDIEAATKEKDRLLHAPISSSYGTNDASDNGAADQIDTSPTPSIGSLHSDEFEGYDWLEDIDKHKEIYRLKKKLFVSDLSRKPYKKLAKKFNVYYWNLLTVAVFYALPVIQLVLTYQRVVNTSGDQDICYYNFFCARPYHLLSAFNNVYSNIGYMMLGLLFVFLVMRRDRLGKQVYVKDPERAQKFGIPKHYGILYAMGYALFMEGLMSACYHVCPNYSNFQFDTAFMYMIGILGCLRLYQTRHHDVFLNGHFAYAGLAGVIFTSVIGVIFRSRAFWIVFLIFHVIVCFYLSGQIYYMGRVKHAFALHWRNVGTKLSCVKPVYPDRFFLMLVFNIMNWSLSINGLVNIPKDFATYLLGIIICNGLFYVFFYIIMKLRHGEKIKVLPMLMVVLSLIAWCISISFFVKGLTDWQLTPAQSREGNKECEMLGFYDYHDLWHFLSATAMFFTFMGVLTLDDDLDFKDRRSIAVF